MSPKEKAACLIEKVRMVICQCDDDKISFSATDEQGNDITDDCRIDAYIGSLDDAKKISLIVADECYNEAYKQATEISLIRQDYWKEVKAEIERL